MPESISGRLKGDGGRDGGIHREATFCQNVHDGGEFIEIVASTQDVELFMNEEAGIEADGVFDPADIDDASGVRNFFDGEPIGGGGPNGLDHDIGTLAVRHGKELVMERGLARIEHVARAGAFCEGELFGVQIDGNGRGAARESRNESAETDRSAADNGDRVGGRNATALDGVEADGERFDQSQLAQGEMGRVNDLLPGDGEEAGHGAVALDAESPVELAGVRAAAQAGGAGAAEGIGIDSHVEAGTEMSRDVGTGFDNGGGDLMAGDARIGDERILAAEGAEICPAKADEARLEQDLASGRGGRRKVSKGGLAGGRYIERLHEF